LISSQFIPTERLEGSGVVQRCALTPTDLLHINGSFVKWNPEAAKRMIKILAQLCGMEVEELVKFLIHKFENNLAEEIFKKQLEKDVDTSEEHTALSQLLMNSIISKTNSSYSIDVTLKNPIIGIGAPVDYFLPAASEKLHAQAIIPQDADVANALGAITSNIVIKKTLSIIPGRPGGFVVQGISGAKTFSQVNAAESLAIGHLKKLILDLAKKAGTTSERVEMEIVDKIVKTKNGSNLFMGRLINATLTGAPDLLQKNGVGDEEIVAL
jgi:N-methylhydantoinase A/oxoprolinase/acetone carboxylase beta subunit